ncbi:MAG TPA: PAS domain S-box protein [Caulobacteraceae bacterium]|jgi:PAS domain S-box-containing protein|nr:PAS domain S-box protein [Caulobacteraceae bacterium]
MDRPHPSPASANDDGLYRLLVGAITDYAIYMLDADGLVTSWNPGARRFKGYEADEIVGQHFSRFYTPEDQAAGAPARGLATAATQGRYETEGWRVRKDGERFWAHVVIDPIRDPSGALIGYAKVTRDLTEQKRAAEALRRTEQQFRLLVEGVTDYAIYMLDPSGRVSSWNSGAQRIKGYQADEIIGEHFSRFYTDEDRQAGAPDTFLGAARETGRYEMEGWRVRKDGTRFWAHVVIDTITGEDGEVLGFAKITRDVTEQREAQRALEQAREALFQSQKLESIGQLTGGLAHDFNNLLMAILGSLELVQKRTPEDPRVSRLIDNAIQGAKRGAVLTQRMLAFARRQELKREAVDLPSLVLGMAGLLERTLGPSISIETKFPLGLTPVETDPAQMEAALLNLAINARDAMPGGGTIVIAARRANVAADEIVDLAPGPYVCLSMTDNGEGMDDETLERAAEPFFTTKGVGKGTGLGLSMIHGLALQSGGALRLNSRLGEGTTVELWFPVAKVAAEPVPAPPPQPPASRSRRLTVLAVDDDDLVLLNTVAMLEELGHAVLQADTGAKALDLLRRQAGVDLIVTDQAMPKMTGAELIDAVRAERPHLPILLASGYADLPPDLAPGLRRLAKPFGLGDLARAIDELDLEPAD